jgi:hypothetical protein
MAEKVCDNGYFTYKGINYGIGTKVMITEEACRKYGISPQNKSNPYTFTCGVVGNWYSFNWIHEDGWKHGRSDITLHNPDEEIEKIIYPIYVELVPWYQVAMDNMKSKKVQPDIFGGVLLYIIVMLVALIFKDTFVIWTFITIIFIIWLIDQYRT